MIGSPNAPRIGTERIQNIGFGFKHAAALMAAIELSLFTKISEGASTIEEISSACGLSLLNAERLVVACAALRLIEKRDGKYVNGPDIEMYLAEGRPRPQRRRGAKLHGGGRLHSHRDRRECAAARNGVEVTTCFLRRKDCGQVGLALLSQSMLFSFCLKSIARLCILYGGFDESEEGYPFEEMRG
jgi:hypothetical protein